MAGKGPTSDAKVQRLGGDEVKPRLAALAEGPLKELRTQLKAVREGAMADREGMLQVR